MKEYKVSYYLGDMLHTYIVTAECEEKAMLEVINKLYYPEIMHDFKIEKYTQKWN